MKRSLSNLLLGAIVLLLIGLYWLRLGGDANETLRSALYAGIPWVAVGSVGAALLAYGRGTLRPTLACLALALLSYAVAEGLWVWYQSVLHVDPFPSLADLFYMLAYPLFFAAIVSAIWRARVNWKRIHSATRFLLVVVAALVAFLVAYFGIYRGYHPELSTIANVVSIGYSGADLVLLILCLAVLVLAWEYRGGRLMEFWLLLFAAFSLTLMADIGFSIENAPYIAGDVLTVNVLDSLWILSYLSYAIAAQRMLAYIHAAQRKLAVT
ncbi:hypothetical protein EBS80_05685 [bacterium]|nr:hypothetical protein [bacterium]